MMNIRTPLVLLLAAAAACGAESVSVTQIRMFTPYGPGGLSKSLSVSETVSGNCFAESLANASRADAWRCNAGNAIQDPCFQNVMGDARIVACLRSPWDDRVTLLTLASPPPSASRKEIAHEKALPWALELANGDHCTLMTGATASLAGMRINYGCPGGGLVAGDIDRSHPVWRVFYQKEGASSLDQVDVVVAWY